MSFKQNTKIISIKENYFQKVVCIFIFSVVCLGCNIDAKILKLENKNDVLPSPVSSESSGPTSDLGLEFDGIINTTLIHQNKMYIGGTFSSVGVNKGSLGSLAIDGEISASTLPVNGDVHGMVKDSLGRTYIAGSFTRVGNLERKYLIRILSDGNLDESFDAQIVGLASLDLSSGGGLAFGITQLAIENNILYFVGSFGAVLGQPRMNAASINVSSPGAAISLGTWRPDFDMAPQYFRVENGKITAGSKTILLSNTEFRGAAFFDNNGNAKELYTENDTPLFTSVQEDGIGGYLGLGLDGLSGGFALSLAHIGADGKVKKRLSSLRILAAKVSGNYVYIYSIDGSNGAKLEKYSLDTFSKVSNWNLNILCSSECSGGNIEVYNGLVYLFSDNVNSINGVSKTKAFAINANTGVPTSFDIPTFEGYFGLGDAIIHNSKIYVIMSNYRLGVFNLDGSVSSEFAPSVTLNTVMSIAFDGSDRLYVSAGSPSNIYALNPTDGSVIPNIVAAGSDPLVLPGYVTLTSNLGKIYGMYFDTIAGTSLYILDGAGGYQQKLIGASSAILMGMFTRFCDGKTNNTKGVCLFAVGLGGRYSPKNLYSYDIASQSLDDPDDFDFPSNMNTLYYQRKVGNRVFQHGAEKGDWSVDAYTYVFDATTKQQLFSSSGQQDYLLSSGTDIIFDRGSNRLDLTMAEPMALNTYMNISQGAGISHISPVGDGTALVTGDFTEVGGVPCAGAAYINLGSGALIGTPSFLDPEISVGGVLTSSSLKAGGGAYLGFAGGSLKQGKNVSRLVSLDLATMVVDDLDVLGASVNTIHLDLENPSVPTLFVGGTSLNPWRSNSTANDLLALNLLTPLATNSIPVIPVVDSQGSGQNGVSAIQKFDNKIFVGTYASTVVDSVTMPLFTLTKSGSDYVMATDYFVADMGSVSDLKSDGDRLYILGNFSQLDRIEAGAPLGAPVDRGGFAVINKSNQLNNFDLGGLNLRFPASADQAVAKAKIEIVDNKVHLLGIGLDSDPTKNLAVIGASSSALVLDSSEYVLGESLGLGALMGMFKIGGAYLFSGVFSSVDGVPHTNVFKSNLDHQLSPESLEMPSVYSIYTGGSRNDNKYYLTESNMMTNVSTIKVMDLSEH